MKARPKPWMSKHLVATELLPMDSTVPLHMDALNNLGLTDLQKTVKIVDDVIKKMTQYNSLEQSK